MITIITPGGQKYSLVVDPEQGRVSTLNEITELAGISSYTYSDEFYEKIYMGYIFIWYAIFFILIFNLTVIFWFTTFFDLLRTEFTNKQNKWIWFLSHFLVPFIAPVFYYFIAGRQKIRIEDE